MGETSTGMHGERVDVRPGPGCFEWFGGICIQGNFGKVRLTVIARRQGWSIIPLTEHERFPSSFRPNSRRRTHGVKALERPG